LAVVAIAAPHHFPFKSVHHTACRALRHISHAPAGYTQNEHGASSQDEILRAGNAEQDEFQREPEPNEITGGTSQLPALLGHPAKNEVDVLRGRFHFGVSVPTWRRWAAISRSALRLRSPISASSARENKLLRRVGRWCSASVARARDRLV
jgi:hypothetical protein